MICLVSNCWGYTSSGNASDSDQGGLLVSIDPISIQTRRVAQPFFGRQRSIVAMLEWQRMWIIFWSNSNDAERAEYAEGRRNCRRWDWLDDLGLAFMTRKLIRLVAPAVE